MVLNAKPGGLPEVLSKSVGPVHFLGSCERRLCLRSWQGTGFRLLRSLTAYHLSPGEGFWGPKAVKDAPPGLWQCAEEGRLALEASIPWLSAEVPFPTCPDRVRPVLNDRQFWHFYGLPLSDLGEEDIFHSRVTCIQADICTVPGGAWSQYHGR